MTKVVDSSRLQATEAIAAGLVQARRTGVLLPAGALPVPASVDAAMQVQGLVRKHLGCAVPAWKVAVGPGGDAIAAPMFDVYDAGCELPLIPRCKIEVELAVRLAREIPIRTDRAYDRAALIAAIDHVILGVEIVGGRFDGTSDVPFAAFLADNLGNSAYVRGDPLPLAVLEGFAGQCCHVTLDGAAIHAAPATHPAGDPLAPLLAYANRQNDHLGGLQAGQVVTTGSLCGVIAIEACGLLKVEVSGVSELSFRFTKPERSSEGSQMP